MKKYILFGIFVCLSALLFAQKLPKTGLVFSKEDTLIFPKKTELLSKATYDNLPNKYSLENYLPSVANQGEFPTCVSFSTAYYMRTVLEAVERKLTDRASIDKIAFSPSYIHEKIKNPKDTACINGTTLPDALLALRDFGVPYHAEVPYHSCGLATNKLINSAVQHKIREIIVIPFPKNGTPLQKANGIKKALSENTPVVFGIAAPESFLLNTQKLWTPAPKESIDLKTYGHALCIIGYDDNLAGGAFKIVNSWGKDWGENGLCWIRYSDFFRFTPAPVAFQVYPMPSEQKLVSLKADVVFKLRSGEEMPVSYNQLSFKGQVVTDDEEKPIKNPEIVQYFMKNDYASRTSFKLFLNNSQKAYIYVIGTDKSLKITPLFPTEKNVSPLIGGSSTIILPAENKSITLDDNIGKEHTLVLFSREPLNFEALIQSLQNANGSFEEKIMKVLGNKLINSKEIKYSNTSASFEINGNTEKSIIPLLVSFNHI